MEDNPASNDPAPAELAERIPFNIAEFELDPATSRLDQQLVDNANGDLRLLELHLILRELRMRVDSGKMDYEEYVEKRHSVGEEIAVRQKQLGLI